MLRRPLWRLIGCFLDIQMSASVREGICGITGSGPAREDRFRSRWMSATAEDSTVGRRHFGRFRRWPASCYRAAMTEYLLLNCKRL